MANVDCVWKDFDDGSGSYHVDGELKAKYDMVTREICINGKYYSMNMWNSISLQKVHDFIELLVSK